MENSIPVSILVLLNISLISLSLKAGNTKLWYTRPAQEWSQEALPIGNGRMGAMLYGEIEQEKIQFNEQSLWSGDNNWDGEYETGDHGFGSYRNFGEMTIDFDIPGSPTNYCRSLDIANGIHPVIFNVSDIIYTREAFASYPDQVMTFNYASNVERGFSGKISLSSAQGASSSADAHGLSFQGIMPNQLKYAARVFLIQKDGKTWVDGKDLIFENCTSFTLLLDARTNYKPDHKSRWRGEDPMPVIGKELALAQIKQYKKLRSNHVKDLSAIRQRVSIPVRKDCPLICKVYGTTATTRLGPAITITTLTSKRIIGRQNQPICLNATCRLSILSLQHKNLSPSCYPQGSGKQ